MEFRFKSRKWRIDFKPPRKNRFVNFLAYGMIPLVLRMFFKIEKVEIEEEDLLRLKKLRGERAILTPNHPTNRDAVVMFQLSKFLDERFNFLAARELFGRQPMAWFLQRCGVYSVRRGIHDRESFRTTLQLLVQGKHKIVVFPEGLTYYRNDRVMPFQEGVSLFGFWALEELAKKGTLPPLYLVPVAIKYLYLHEMSQVISHALSRLERRLGISLNRQSLYEQLRGVGESVLASAEREYGVRPKPDDNLNERIQGMKGLLVTRIATFLGIRFKEEEPLADRIRILINSIDQIVYEEPRGSEYELSLHRHRQDQVKTHNKDLSRALRFIATYDGYVQETRSSERFLDVIGQLEREVFGKSRRFGPFKVLLRIGEPINLLEYFDLYLKDRRGVLRTLTTDLENRVQCMLNAMAKFSIPVEDAIL